MLHTHTPRLGGGNSNFFLFSPLFGEDFPFDSYFSDGLVQPPTRRGQTGQTGRSGPDQIKSPSGLERCYGEQIEYQGAEDRLYFPGANVDLRNLGARKPHMNDIYRDDDFK